MFLERIRKTHFPPTDFCTWLVDPERCTGCGLCAETCPGQLLEMGEKYPWQKTCYAIRGKDFPVGCIGCRNCVSVCPKDAIRVEGQYRVLEGRFKTLLNEPQSPNPFREDSPRPFDQIEGELTGVERVIYRRRSSRLYDRKKQLNREIVHRVLETGRFAPSAGNCQPWKYLVVQDRDLLEEIIEETKPILRMLNRIYLGKKIWNKILAWFVSIFLPERMDQRLHGGTHVVTDVPEWDMYLHAPTVVFVLGDTRGVSDYKVDCAISTHNMMLTAHALGLASCYIGFSTAINYRGKLKKRLGIHWPYQVVTAITLGYPKVESDKAVAREVPPISWYESGWEY